MKTWTACLLLAAVLYTAVFPLFVAQLALLAYTLCSMVAANVLYALENPYTP
jgi:hypothetical protein